MAGPGDNRPEKKKTEKVVNHPDTGPLVMLLPTAMDAWPLPPVPISSPVGASLAPAPPASSEKSVFPMPPLLERTSGQAVVSALTGTILLTPGKTTVAVPLQPPSPGPDLPSAQIAVPSRDDAGPPMAAKAAVDFRSQVQSVVLPPSAGQVPAPLPSPAVPGAGLHLPPATGKAARTDDGGILKGRSSRAGIDVSSLTGPKNAPGTPARNEGDSPAPALGLTPAIAGAPAPVMSSPGSHALSTAETFQRLDGAVGTGASLLHAGPHEVSVGVRDPDYGWLEIKTQSTAGQVSASLSAGSPEAQAGLAAQLPGLVQHLADNNVHVESVSVQNGWGQNAQNGWTQNGNAAGQQQGGQNPNFMQGQSQDHAQNQNAYHGGNGGSFVPAAAPVSSAVASVTSVERRPADSGISIHV